jgi:hypothetical protein
MSSGGEVAVRFTATDDGKAQQAFARTAAGADDTAAALDKASFAANRLDRSTQRFVDQLKNAHAGPIRELQAEHEKLAKLVTSNAITEDEANTGKLRAQQRYQDALRKSREEQQKLSGNRGGKDQADAGGTPTGDTQAAAALAAYNAELARLSAALAKAEIGQEAFNAASKAAGDEYAHEMRQAAAETDKADQQLRQFSEQLKRVDAKPLDKLAEKMAKYDDAVKRGGITQQQHATLAKKAQDEYQAELDATIRKQQELERSAQDAAENGGGFFEQMSTTAKMAWAAAGVYVVSVLNEIKQASDEAGQALKAAAPSRGTLAQLALDSPEKYAALTKQAEQLRATGVTASLEEANRFVFSMESAGAGAEIDTFAQAKKLGIMQDPSSMIASAAGIRESMGADQTGTLEDLINRALVAGGSSPSKAEELLKGAGKAGVTARQQGIGVDELLAMTSILSTAKGGAEEGGQRVNALLRALAISEPDLDKRGRVTRDSAIKETLRGKTGAQIAEDETLGAMSPSELMKVMKSQEAVEAYGVLRLQRGKLRELTPEVAAGVEQKKLSSAVGIVQRDKRVMAAVRSNEAAGALEVSRLDRGGQALDVQSSLARTQQQIEATPEASFTRRAINATPVGQAYNVLTGNVGEAMSGPASLLGRDVKSAMVRTTTERIGRPVAEAIGAEGLLAKYLEMMSGTQTKASAASDKLDAAADKLAKAAEAIEAKAAPVRTRPDLTGPARREAAEVAR